MKMLKVIVELLAGKQTDTNNVSIDELTASLFNANDTLINEWTRNKP